MSISESSRAVVKCRTVEITGGDGSTYRSTIRSAYASSSRAVHGPLTRRLVHSLILETFTLVCRWVRTRYDT